MAERTNNLASALREEIAQGMYGGDGPLPSERELSLSRGLSRTTVRRAIQQLVEEGVVYRLPGSGTFVGQPPRFVGEPTAQLATIGLILPSLANPYFGELAAAIERACLQNGYQLLLGQSSMGEGTTESYLARYVENEAVKGVITIAPEDEVALGAYRRLAQASKPYLFVVRHAERLNADSVATDHVGGARNLMRHLLQHGHRRIAYIGVAGPPAHRHFQGYREALHEAGIAEDPALNVRVEDEDLETVGERGVQTLLESGIGFTAIFAQIDPVAIGVLRALRLKGLRVPGDVSVVGFDNIPSAAHVDPPLSSVDHTVGEIGRLAVLLLQDRISGRYDGPARRVIIQPRLVLRASSGPAPERAQSTEYRTQNPELRTDHRHCP
jgi:DNA-binding LacI/PurR family transcriptional regulator/biotin operon repressor